MKRPLLLTVARVTGTLIQAFLILQLAREANLSDFGTYSFWFAALGLAASFYDFGLSVAIPRTLGRAQFEAAMGLIKLHSKIQRLPNLFALACTSLGLLGVVPPWIGILMFAVFTEYRIETVLTYFYSVGTLRVPVLSIVIRRLASVMLWVVVHGQFDPLMSMAIALASGATIGLLYVRLRTRSIFKSNQETAPLKAAWKAIRRLLPTQYLGAIRNGDILMLQLFSNASQVAIYGAGIRLSSPVNLFYQSSSAMLVSKAASMRGIELRSSLMKINFGSLAATLALLICSSAGEVAVSWLLGTKYEPFANTIWLMIALSPVVSMSQPLTAIAQAVHLERLANQSTIWFAVLLLIATAVGSAFFGAIGTIFGVIAAALVRVTLMSIGLLRYANGVS